MPKIGKRLSKAFFNGIALGLFGGSSVYILAHGVNILAQAQVIDPIAFLVIVIGGMMTGSIGIELSKDVDDTG